MNDVKIQKRSFCPVNYAVEEFGDLWSLLIVRDILFFGKKTYGEFLSSREKIATNILADRLKQLVQKGIIAKRSDDNDKRKEIYALTEKGRDLYPIMLQMILWSAKYDSQTPISQSYAEFMRNNDEKIVKAKIKEIYLENSKRSSLQPGSLKV